MEKFFIYIIFCWSILGATCVFSQGSCVGLPQIICQTQSSTCIWNPNASICQNLLTSPTPTANPTPGNNNEPCAIYALSYSNTDEIYPTYYNYITKIIPNNMNNNWVVAKTWVNTRKNGEIFNGLAVAQGSSNDVRAVSSNFIVDGGKIYKLGLNINANAASILTTVNTPATDSGVFDYSNNSNNTVYFSDRGRIYSYNVATNSTSLQYAGNFTGRSILDIAFLGGTLYFISVANNSNEYNSRLSKVNQLGQYIFIGGLQSVRLTGLAKYDGGLIGIGQNNALYRVKPSTGEVTFIMQLPNEQGLIKGFDLTSSNCHGSV